MSKRWDDDEEEFENAGGGGNGDNEFWMEFNQDAASMIDLNRQQEFDVAHKQLNIEVLEKAIRVAKSRWFWWLFASQKSKLKAIRQTYRSLLTAVENSL
jgi:hypothetical protein